MERICLASICAKLAFIVISKFKTAEMAAGTGFTLGSNRTVELKGLAGTHRLTNSFRRQTSISSRNQSDGHSHA